MHESGQKSRLSANAINHSLEERWKIRAAGAAGALPIVVHRMGNPG
jgi:hypothetical protein